jgi:hypothetical protein
MPFSLSLMPDISFIDIFILIAFIISMPLLIIYAADIDISLSLLITMPYYFRYYYC